MTYAHRTDANQAAIVDALRRLGFSVAITSGLGDGFPDLAVGLWGRTYLIEVKDGNKRLTASEVTWHNEWKGHAIILRSVDEAVEWANGLRSGGGAIGAMPLHNPTMRPLRPQ